MRHRKYWAVMRAGSRIRTHYVSRVR